MRAAVERAGVRCGCGVEKVITRDAIGRERHRCPSCTRVAAPRLPRPDTVFNRQSSLSSTDLQPGMEPAVRAVKRSAECRLCGIELPVGRRGRLPTRCADRDACLFRAMKRTPRTRGAVA